MCDFSVVLFTVFKMVKPIKNITICMLILLFSSTNDETQQKNVCSVSIDCPIRWIFNQAKNCNWHKHLQKHIILCISFRISKK